MPSFGTVVWVAIGLLIGIVVWKTGIGMLRSLTRPLPPPPPPGEMRKVNVRYRCDVCGVELRLTMAPDEDPPPPKHCLEDMVARRPDHGVIELSTGLATPCGQVTRAVTCHLRHLVARNSPPRRQARPTSIGQLLSGNTR